MLNVREFECKFLKGSSISTKYREYREIEGSKNRDSVVYGENNVLPSSGLCRTPTLQTEQAMASKRRQ